MDVHTAAVLFLQEADDIDCTPHYALKAVLWLVVLVVLCIFGDWLRNQRGHWWVLVSLFGVTTLILLTLGFAFIPDLLAAVGGGNPSHQVWCEDYGEEGGE